MSYPYLSDVIQAATGYALPLPLATFGLFVALGALAAGASFRAELKRFYEAGRIGPAYVHGLSRPPQEVVSDFIIIVLIAGVLGARLFHILDHLDQFFADPLGMLLTRSGLSIFGGLIFGTFAGMLCARRWRLPVTPLLDAAAPALMLGYGIGRIGCQISGDGDWGIAANMALKPAWLPSWLWAQTYDNNIYGELIAAPGVYPTPMYETAMALLCFALLWAVRRHPFRIGWLFSLYLLLAGAERLLIEQIRVNPVINLGSLHATQAELIASALIVLGLTGLLLKRQRR
ncbi:prolipoprotein diacylglyceryl transferase [Pseudoduganella sp. FT93W]|uniref:Phosphatidylglycerol--prolipoprotein diacylglyceryl transferase n=1 Tax=Duganella fentianensis TaxID=2692177 RepID=A0A845I089_9BURK|nr:prolipoprotein diacylglyceryl transferase [Duganella fentianensis]MYN45151.1 prolipoprotein diacylglyceryl transferase [Duganella fentianensis]